MTFGWGRRVCSGQGLAEQGTFITIARLLWGFRIEKALDENGKEIPVDIFDFTYVPFFFFPFPSVSLCVLCNFCTNFFLTRNGLNWRPSPFKCRITPRSPEIKATIEREGQEALANLAPYEGETKYRMSKFYQQETLR